MTRPTPTLPRLAGETSELSSAPQSSGSALGASGARTEQPLRPSKSCIQASKPPEGTWAPGGPSPTGRHGIPLHRTASRLLTRSNGTFADAAGLMHLPDLSRVVMRRMYATSPLPLLLPVPEHHETGRRSSAGSESSQTRIDNELEAGQKRSVTQLAQGTKPESGPEFIERLVAVHQHHDGNEFHYPDGGLEAWLCLAGGVCASFGAFGLAASVGAFQSYYRENLLKEYSPSAVAWIGSTQAALCFGACLFTGPAFDRLGPRPLLAAGTFLLVFSFCMLSLSTQFYQIFLCHAGVMSFGMCMMFIVPMGAVGQWFFLRRGLAFGILMMGASIGAIIWPSIVANVPQKIGWGWTMRLIALLLGILGTTATLLVKTRLPPKPSGPFFAFNGFKNPAYACVALSFPAFGFFSFLTFIGTYGRLAGLETLAPYLLMITNGSAAFGRLFFGTMADMMGIINVAVCGITGMAVLTFGWIGMHTKAPLIILCILYGFLSGAPISVQGPMVTETASDVTLAGTLIGQALMCQSFAQLTGPPIFGAIVGSGSDADQLDRFPNAICFAGASLAVCAVLLISARCCLSHKLLDVV